MKKLNIIVSLVCALINTACENDDTLNDTRVPDITAPSVSLSSVTVNKYDATFVINVSETGNPAIREYGVLVSSEAQPTSTNSTVLVANGSETSANLVASFAPGATYYACAYALTANKFITSEVKQFETASHRLSAFLGSKTLSGYNLLNEGTASISVTITPDPDDADEKTAYLSGLSSDAGVQLQLADVKLIFDLEAGTVTIPDGQIVAESKYGNYRYVAINQSGEPTVGDIVGVIESGNIQFDALAAMIVAGGNAGLFHWAYGDITIK